MFTGRKLLLADDSVTIQKVIDLTFTDEGLEVTTVGNGEQAISQLEEIRPDIVLADIFMPGRSGYEVCEHIKRDERFRHIPVMLLVGSFEPFDEAEARRVGADDYLTKPFQSIRQLVGKVASLLSGGGVGPDEASTRDLEPPKEAEDERENPSADIHTADTAPLRKEQPEDEPHLAGHESLDDEMIEARPANPMDEPRATIGADAARSTSPFSPSDLEETGLETTAPENETSPEPLKETIQDFSQHAMNEEPLSTETHEQPSARYMNNAAAADEALLDLGDIEPPMSTLEADDFILDLQDDESPAPSSQPSTDSAGSSQHEMAATRASEDFEGAQVVAAAPERAFEEESAPAISEPAETTAGYASEAGTLAEAQTAEGPASVDTLPAEETRAAQAFKPHVMSHGLAETMNASMMETMLPEEALAPAEAAEEGAAASAETARGAGQITLEQLSPEVIDRIARRAVELLSAKVVEEVAWEVVPQLAELIIKRKLEEEKAR